MIIRFKRSIAALLIAALPFQAVSADVGSSMDNFLSDVGGAANVTGPTAFQGQAAGYYSLGNVWTRYPQKTTNIANLQLPRARAGCGGIDIFAGSFSFINASEIVAMLKAVANNAVGFAFSLAIDTVCPECSKIMQEFSQKAQLMNNLNINSCEMAQGLVGGIWPKGDLADKAICEPSGFCGVALAAATTACSRQSAPSRRNMCTAPRPEAWAAAASVCPSCESATLLPSCAPSRVSEAVNTACSVQPVAVRANTYTAPLSVCAPCPSRTSCR